MINDILKDINAYIKDNVYFGNEITFYREAHIQSKDDKTYPLAYTDLGKGVKISLEDKKALQIFYVVTSNTRELDNERSKGASIYRYLNYNVRLYAIGWNELLKNVTWDQNTDAFDLISKAVPAYTKENVFVQMTASEIDRNAVLAELYDGYDMQKLNLNTVAFSMDLNLRKKINCKNMADFEAVANDSYNSPDIIIEGLGDIDIDEIKFQIKLSPVSEAIAEGTLSNADITIVSQDASEIVLSFKADLTGAEVVGKYTDYRIQFQFATDNGIVTAPNPPLLFRIYADYVL